MHNSIVCSRHHLNNKNRLPMQTTSFFAARSGNKQRSNKKVDLCTSSNELTWYAVIIPIFVLVLACFNESHSFFTFRLVAYLLACWCCCWTNFTTINRFILWNLIVPSCFGFLLSGALHLHNKHNWK